MGAAGRVALVFAIARNGVIGRDGALPWDFPEDRRHFEEVTSGHAVVMGRRTWEETGRPLPERTNIVVSRTIRPSGARVVPSLDEALVAAWAIDDEPFVIGGVRLFEAALPIATRVVVTDIPADYDGDTVLRFDRSSFRVVSSRTGDHGLVFSELEPDLHEAPPDDPEVLALHQRYFAELREHLPTFEPPPPDLEAITIVAHQAGRPAACGSIRKLDALTFEVKRMFVAPEARAHGHARRILAALERKASSLRAQRIVLDTAAPLATAIRLYQRAGYAAIPRYNDNPYAAHWFEKRLG